MASYKPKIIELIEAYHSEDNGDTEEFLADLEWELEPRDYGR
jgi:hypothetical protein